MEYTEPVRADLSALSERVTYIDPVDIAWVAGIIEGEGCFTVANPKTKYPAVVVTVRMTDEDTVRRLQEATGLGTVAGPYVDKRKPHYKPSWCWNVSRWNEVVRLLGAIAPMMSKRRRERIMEVVERKLAAIEAHAPRTRGTDGRYVRAA